MSAIPRLAASRRLTRGPLWALALCAGAAALLAPLPLAQAAPAHRVVRLEASQFAFGPAVVRVAAGDTVSLEVAATDVAHGVYVDGYDLSVTAEPGRTARLQFVADRPGMFRLRCAVTCGPLHPFMVGKLYVGPALIWWRGLAVLGIAAAAGWLAREPQ